MNRCLSVILAVVFAIFVFSDFAHAQPKRWEDMTQQEKDNEAGKAAGAIAGLGVCTILGFVCFGIVLLLVDLLPMVIAISRGHPDSVAISIITLLLGWTLIGWIVALVWSVKSFARDRDGRARDY